MNNIKKLISLIDLFGIGGSTTEDAILNYSSLYNKASSNKVSVTEVYPGAPINVFDDINNPLKEAVTSFDNLFNIIETKETELKELFNILQAKDSSIRNILSDCHSFLEDINLISSYKDKVFFTETFVNPLYLSFDSSLYNNPTIAPMYLSGVLTLPINQAQTKNLEISQISFVSTGKPLTLIDYLTDGNPNTIFWLSSKVPFSADLNIVLVKPSIINNLNITLAGNKSLNPIIEDILLSLDGTIYSSVFEEIDFDEMNRLSNKLKGVSDFVFSPRKCQFIKIKINQNAVSTDGNYYIGINSFLAKSFVYESIGQIVSSPIPINELSTKVSATINQLNDKENSYSKILLELSKDNGASWDQISFLDLETPASNKLLSLNNNSYLLYRLTLSKIPEAFKQTNPFDKSLVTKELTTDIVNEEVVNSCLSFPLIGPDTKIVLGYAPNNEEDFTLPVSMPMFPDNFVNSILTNNNYIIISGGIEYTPDLIDLPSGPKAFSFSSESRPKAGLSIELRLRGDLLSFKDFYSFDINNNSDLIIKMLYDIVPLSKSFFGIKYAQVADYAFQSSQSSYQNLCYTYEVVSNQNDVSLTLPFNGARIYVVPKNNIDFKIRKIDKFNSYNNANRADEDTSDLTLPSLNSLSGAVYNTFYKYNAAYSDYLYYSIETFPGSNKAIIHFDPNNNIIDKSGLMIFVLPASPPQDLVDFYFDSNGNLVIPNAAKYISYSTNLLRYATPKSLSFDYLLGHSQKFIIENPSLKPYFTNQVDYIDGASEFLGLGDNDTGIGFYSIDYANQFIYTSSSLPEDLEYPIVCKVAFLLIEFTVKYLAYNPKVHPINNSKDFYKVTGGKLVLDPGLKSYLELIRSPNLYSPGSQISKDLIFIYDTYKSTESSLELEPYFSPIITKLSLVIE